MIVAVRPSDEERLLDALRQAGAVPHSIGEVVAGATEVVYV